MINKFIRLLVLGVLPLFFLNFSAETHAALADDLRDGHHVLLMRHADAPGFGDPSGYVIGQCSTQRNLGDYGRKQAKIIGLWLSKQGIEEARVFSSPWCRCIDTATLLNLGQVKIQPSLGSFFDDMSLEKSQTKALELFIKNELQQQTRAPIILVTHHVNIQAYTGRVVSVGDMVLVRVNKNGEYISHTVYPSP